MFAAGYGIARIIEDFLREDLRHFGLTGSQWTATVTALVCLFTLLVLRRTPKWGRWDERDGAVVAAPTLEGEPSREDAHEG